jgi:hypothetical protein
LAGLEIAIILMCKILGIKPLTEEDILAESEKQQDYYMVKFNQNDFYDEI